MSEPLPSQAVTHDHQQTTAGTYQPDPLFVMPLSSLGITLLFNAVQRGILCYHLPYLDDYVTIGPAHSLLCAANMKAMLDTFSEFGFMVNPKKVCSPRTELEFLGIVIDSNRMELRISQERLDAVMEELRQWKSRKCAKKREMLSPIGKLSFISRVVRSGRTFLRRMIELSTKVKHLHHRLRLIKAFQADIDWWLEYLPSWNGVVLSMKMTGLLMQI